MESIITLGIKIGFVAAVAGVVFLSTIIVLLTLLQIIVAIISYANRLIMGDK